MGSCAYAGIKKYVFVMKKIKLEILGLSPGQSQRGTSFALILGEKEGKRRLPIIIGMFEAQSIALELENIRPARPMTHDLFKDLAQNFSFTFQEVLISGLKDGVFFAEIVALKDQKVTSIDARPSDAIAIALKFDIDVYIDEAILNDVGFGEEETSIEKETSKKKYGHLPFDERVKKMKTKELKEALEKAISKEAYEQAALIRDELHQRKYDPENN